MTHMVGDLNAKTQYSLTIVMLHVCNIRFSHPTGVYFNNYYILQEYGCNQPFNSSLDAFPSTYTPWTVTVKPLTNIFPMSVESYYKFVDYPSNIIFRPV